MLNQLAESDATRLILEFKSHSTTDRNNAVVDACLDMIRQKGLEDMVDYIAFDYNVCKRVVAALPEAEVGYLNGDKDPATVHADGIRCIDYSYGNLNSHPTWIDEAHELGMKVNVWTVNSDNDLMVWMGKGVDYITTDNPQLVGKFINE
jgi:glycerophosphoryl diester phosphodiesterase